MDAALLDTDILNEVLKQKNADVVRHATDYLAQYGQLAISSMTWYEVLRGLLEKTPQHSRRSSQHLSVIHSCYR